MNGSTQVWREELSPTTFLERAAGFLADKVAVVDGQRQFTYAEFASRCRRLQAALVSAGVRPGDRVAAWCTNSHVMLELHQAVPACGAVLVPLNTRLAAAEVDQLLDHSGASLIVATREHAVQAAEAAGRRSIGWVAESSSRDYDEWVAAHEPVEHRWVASEEQLLSINYTSGTTGTPKGVMYHHRGAYLQALAMVHHAGLTAESRYLWTLPMFHCHGWSFTWAVAAAGGMHVCTRSVEPAEVWRLEEAHGVTHLSAAPTVLTMLAEHGRSSPSDRRVHVDTGGAPPTPILLERLDALGLDVTHLYGLTETYGPVAVNVWRSEWDSLPTDRRAALRARQGVANIVPMPLSILDAAGDAVPADGRTPGEIAVRGNTVMAGYFRDEVTTAASMRAGHLLTGDVAVMHPDGYLEIRDRRKDVIISGGENISSVEVERVLDTHPAVVESAVIGVPDDRWGEAPVAVVRLREGCSVEDAELIAFAREHLAGYKVPRLYEYRDLPKTPTGKIQKNLLRDDLRSRRAGERSGES